jgi:cell pole-organizing protein PopZ
MANPSTAHEPSMEEILASIRQIISEDSDGASAQRVESTPTESAAPIENQDEAEREPEALAPEVAQIIAEPLPEREPEVATEMPAEPAQPRPRDPRPAPDAMSEAYLAPRPAVVRQPKNPGNAGTLLSRDQDAAVSGAFGALAHTMLAQNARTLEDVVE